MKKLFQTKLTLSAILLLSGCATHKVENSLKDGTPVCKLQTTAKIVRPGFVTNTSIFLGIKKINATTLKFWTLFTPGTPQTDPFEKPGVILKIYKNEKISNNYTLNGRKHPNSDLMDDGCFSENDIWNLKNPYVYFQSYKEKAVSFDVSTEQFENILSSDKTEILIQTHYTPLILTLDKDIKPSFLDFKVKCLSD
jgi:hypothetical protein